MGNPRTTSLKTLLAFQHLSWPCSGSSRLLERADKRPLCFSFLSLKNKAALTRANITHIVSVLRLQPSEDLFAPYKHLAIEVDDVDDENILEHFPRAIAFIQSGLDEGGSVLIHW